MWIRKGGGSNDSYTQDGNNNSLSSSSREREREERERRERTIPCCKSPRKLLQKRNHVKAGGKVHGDDDGMYQQKEISLLSFTGRLFCCPEPFLLFLFPS